MPRGATPPGIIPRPEYKITPEVLAKCEEAASRGLTQSQVAAVLGIHPTTLINKKKEYPELSEAFERGRARAVAKIERAAFKNATLTKLDKEGNVVSYGDTDMQKFLLKTRAGYKENDQSAVTIVIPTLIQAGLEQEAAKMFKPRVIEHD